MVRGTKLTLFLRYVSATMTVCLSGWLLLVYWSLREEVNAKLACWTCMGSLPSHLMTRMTVALLAGVALPFLAAWLIPTRNSNEIGPQSSISTFLWTYPFRLILSFVCALLAALLLAAIAMVLLDSGVG
jgi:hypothetical protein